MAVTDDALCLQDGEPNAAIAAAATLPEAVEAACLELSRGRPDLLIYAFCAAKEGEPLEFIGKLFGEDAINHGELAGTLFRLGTNGTVFTSAVLRTGRSVWTSSIPRFGWHGLAAALRSQGVRSAGAFPIELGSRIAAVIEILSVDQLQCDLASEALTRDLSVQIADRFRLRAI